jgi:hypothetical protein
MTSTKDITAKFAVAAVAVAMIFSAFAPAAQAQTTEDLQQMINDLLAQVAELQSGLGGVTTGDSMTSDVCPYTWTRDLNMGSEGADVMKLQQFLNSNADTRVSATGAGSAGMETMYYGPATGAAVAKFQVMHRAEVLTPNGLVNPTTYFGPSTRAKANMVCVAAPMTEGEEGEEGSEEEEEEETNNGPLQGEASLDNFEIDDADETDVEEGQEDVEVAEITIEFKDGDAEISRIDLEFTLSGGEAEDTFENISLWIDGDKVAEADASDEDDYQNDDVAVPSILRFSGLDIVAMEDEEVTIVVGASMQDNLDVADLGDWDVTGVSMRFFDADGVATTETGSEITSESASFTVEIEGAGDDLDLRSASNDPDATTLPLDEDDNEEYTVFIFELDADDSDGDISLENLTIDLALGSTTRNLNEVVDDVKVIIDGETFTAEDFDGTADTEAVLFDIDGEITIEEGEMVEVQVVVEFENMDSSSDLQGVTITASVDTADVDAEGESGEEVTVTSSDQDGASHVLRSEGLVITIDGDDIDSEKEVRDTGAGGDRDYGVYTFTFDVTAFGEDFYVNDVAADVNYTLIIDGVDTVLAAASTSASVDINDADDASSSDFEISEGKTAQYIVTVETDTSVEGDVEIRIDSVNYSANDDGGSALTVTVDDADEATSGGLLLN